MVTEDYVSLEVAKLLKEKGFNEPTWTCYTEQAIYHCNFPSSNSRLIEGISAPTLQMVMKWLREVHDLPINIECTIHGFFCSIVHIVRDEDGTILDVEDSVDWETRYYDIPKDAINDAISYALQELI